MTIRRATGRANGIRQFYLKAGAGPPAAEVRALAIEPDCRFARLQTYERNEPDLLRTKTS